MKGVEHGWKSGRVIMEEFFKEAAFGSKHVRAVQE